MTTSELLAILLLQFRWWSGRATHDEILSDANLRHLLRTLGLKSLQQQIRADATHLLTRHSHRRERRREQFNWIDIVKADQAEILRDAQSHRRGGAHDLDRDAMVVGDDARRAVCLHRQVQKISRLLERLVVSEHQIHAM